MKLLLANHFSTATHSLKSNRLRSLLTMLGVAIGVASITTILSLTYGVTRSVDRQIDELGDSVAVIRPGADANESETDLLRSPLSPQRYNTSTLSETDIDQIQSVSDDLAVAPVMTMQSTMRAGDTKVTASTLATTAAFLDTAPLEVAEGQFLDEETDDNVAVVGQQLAIDLFGTEVPIGQRFTMREQTFTVIGVLERQRVPLNYNNTDFNKTAIVSFTAGKTFHQGQSQLQQMNIAASSNEVLEKNIPKIEEALTIAHKGEKDFTVITGEEIAAPTNEMFKAMSAIMLFVATIALLVGGIGIMNIMLVGVAERTREIGIRKAVGASDYTIIAQFLIEALLISTIGGLIGYAFGLLVAWAVGAVMFVVPSISLSVALIAIGVSVGVGVLFGIYPALRASRKDPIECLRQYR